MVIGGVRRAGDGGVGDQLKGHGGSVVHDSSEVHGCSRELGETKEGQECSIGSELDSNLLLGLAGDRAVELLKDLGRECGSCNSSDGLCGVVCQVVLVIVCEGLQLEEILGGEKVV